MINAVDEFKTLGYRRALLVSNNESLPDILSAMLAPVDFDVQPISMDRARNIQPGDYTILIFDGDPDFKFSKFLPAVIVISPSDSALMYDRGADVVIERPLAANILVAKIRAMLRRYNIFI